jgi:hypothetical protein
MTTRHALLGALVAGWLLLFSDDPEGRDPRWRRIADFASESLCERGRAAEAERMALGRIGGALAMQPADNPLRQEALRRAYARTRDHYRCDRD